MIDKLLYSCKTIFFFFFWGGGVGCILIQSNRIIWAPYFWKSQDPEENVQERIFSVQILLFNSGNPRSGTGMKKLETKGSEPLQNLSDKPDVARLCITQCKLVKLWTGFITIDTDYIERFLTGSEHV